MAASHVIRPIKQMSPIGEGWFCPVCGDPISFSPDGSGDCANCGTVFSAEEMKNPEIEEVA